MCHLKKIRFHYKCPLLLETRSTFNQSCIRFYSFTRFDVWGQVYIGHLYNSIGISILGRKRKLFYFTFIRAQVHSFIF